MGSLNPMFLHMRLMEDPHMALCLFPGVQGVFFCLGAMANVSVSNRQISDPSLECLLLVVGRDLPPGAPFRSAGQDTFSVLLSGRMAWADDKSITLSQFQHLAAQRRLGLLGLGRGSQG